MMQKIFNNKVILNFTRPETKEMTITNYQASLFTSYFCIHTRGKNGHALCKNVLLNAYSLTMLQLACASSLRNAAFLSSIQQSLVEKTKLHLVYCTPCIWELARKYAAVIGYEVKL